jgi:hypothetical protein
MAACTYAKWRTFSMNSRYPYFSILYLTGALFGTFSTIDKELRRNLRCPTERDHEDICSRSSGHLDRCPGRARKLGPDYIVGVGAPAAVEIHYRCLPVKRR